MPRCTHRPRYLPKQQSPSPSPPCPAARELRSDTAARAQQADARAEQEIAATRPQIIKDLLEKAKTVVMTPFKLARRPIVALYSKVVWTLWPTAGGATGTAPPVLTGHNPERYGDKAQLENEWGREKTAEAEFVKGVRYGTRYVVPATDDNVTFAIDVGGGAGGGAESSTYHVVRNAVPGDLGRLAWWQVLFDDVKCKKEWHGHGHDPSGNDQALAENLNNVIETGTTTQAGKQHTHNRWDHHSAERPFLLPWPTEHLAKVKAGEVANVRYNAALVRMAEDVVWPWLMAKFPAECQELLDTVPVRHRYVPQPYHPTPSCLTALPQDWKYGFDELHELVEDADLGKSTRRRRRRCYY